MSKRAVAVLTVLLAVGFVFAEWHEVAGGSGKARVRILEQNNTGTTFEVTVPGVEITTKEVDGEEFAVVTLPGGHTAHLVNGRPQVPVVPVLLAIPNGATVSFHVEAKETQKLRVARIFPLQPLPPWGHEPGPFVFDRDFYIEDVSYPGEDAGSVHTAVWRDLNVANIRVYPVRVSPAQGEIEVASRIRVRVNYSGGTYPTTIADWMMPQYARLVDNFAQLSVQPTDDDPNATKYLVFCHSQYQFSPALEELLDWVNHRGYKVEEYYGDDFTPLWIKQKIWEVYGNTQGQLRWVLLVGEYDEVPVKEVPSPVQNLEPISCDYWYTDLLPYPPPSEEVDYHPEIGIARLSPGGDNSGERLQDLEHQIEKILNYQRNPDTHENTGLDWLTRMQLVAGMGHEHAAELCMLRLMDPAQTPLPYYAYDRCFISGYDTYEGSLDVQNALREGRGVLVYFGHGWIGHWDRWYQPQTNTHWEIRHIAETENLGLTPVVYQMACHCGSVQEPECLSEGWMREYRDDPGGGAVACLGATH